MKIKTWDGNNINDTTNYLSVLLQDAYGLPDAGVRTARREGAWPVVTGLERPGHEFTIEVYITGSSVSTLQKQIFQWFDPEDETPKKLVVEDSTGGGDRYVYAICKRIRSTGPTYALHFQIDLVVHGDIRWRESTATTDTWTTTDTALTKTLTNNGEDDAYPVITITPLAGRNGAGYTYYRFITVNWKSDLSATSYPVDLGDGGLDTAALVSGGKMQADGDDLRVYVDGLETPRWLQGENTTDTAVWVNLDFTEKHSATLLTAIGATDTVTEINIGNTSGWPNWGIVLIDSELFHYYTKTATTLTSTVYVPRALYGTSAAEHTTTDTVYLIQHEIFLVYGDATVTAPSTDNDIYKPLFTLASSTNTSWDYDEFYESGVPTRSKAWEPWVMTGVTAYGANQGGTTDNPYTEMGLKIVGSSSQTRSGFWSFSNECGITNANFANGEKYSSNLGTWEASIWGDIEEDTIAEPTTDATFEAWSDNEALTISGGVYPNYLTLYFLIDKAGTDVNGTIYYLEVADVTLTLDSTYTPGVTVGAEAGSYTLDCRITNTTTGDYIDVYMAGMDINQSLEIDTNNKTITYEYNNSSQYQALELPSGPRKDWLKLQAGDNVIQYDESGVTGVRLDFSWDERFYD